MARRGDDQLSAPRDCRIIVKLDVVELVLEAKSLRFLVRHVVGQGLCFRARQNYECRELTERMIIVFFIGIALRRQFWLHQWSSKVPCRGNFDSSGSVSARQHLRGLRHHGFSLQRPYMDVCPVHSSRWRQMPQDCLCHRHFSSLLAGETLENLLRDCPGFLRHETSVEPIMK